MVQLYYHVAGEHLRIGADFRDVFDQAAGNTFMIQELIPLLSRARFDAGGNQRCELSPILDPFFHGAEPVVGEEVLQTGQFAKALPEPLIPAGDNDMPVTSLEGFIRSDAWMLVSQSFWALTGGKVDTRLIREQRHLTVQQGDIDPLPLTGLLACQQRQQDP